MRFGDRRPSDRNRVVRLCGSTIIHTDEHFPRYFARSSSTDAAMAFKVHDPPVDRRNRSDWVRAIRRGQRQRNIDVTEGDDEETLGHGVLAE